jgi:hypothetical protein
MKMLVCGAIARAVDECDSDLAGQVDAYLREEGGVDDVFAQVLEVRPDVSREAWAELTAVRQ